MNVVDFFTSYLDECYKSCKNNNIILTGGRSAQALYQNINKNNQTKKLRNTNIFLTDERNVPPKSELSNQKLIEDNLLSGLDLTNNSTFNAYDINLGDPSLICKSYESIMPDSIDLILLSMGEDGHIASLFPNSTALREDHKKILSVNAPKSPPSRFTITPRVINSAKKIIVLCFGKEKRKKYEEALLDADDTDSIPARLVLDRNWVFDLNEEIDFY